MTSTTSAISVEGIGKRYELGPRVQYRTFRESLMRALRRFGSLAERTKSEELWALRDVSFEVKAGELVGIIGRNGAGKSTLLKVLARITEPSTGRARITGRIGSLLEVGTGFHPELTGRENIYLSGAILGMRRAEINRRFDDIVAFAEVDRFVDTPVKHYSSGMYLRLAFAVAAHLDPEILLVDEVLAVGDARFQRKCLDKMRGVGQSGRTVLFVSHNMPAITRLCERTILLDSGTVLRDGPSAEVVGAYLSSGLGTKASRLWPDPADAPGNEVVRLRGVSVRQLGEIRDAIDIRKPVELEVTFEAIEAGHVLTPNLHFTNEEGVLVFIARDMDPLWSQRPRSPGRYRSTAVIPGNLLAEGTLIVGVAISTSNPKRTHFFEQDVVAFEVIDSMDGDSARGDYGGPIPGIIRPLLEWRTEIE